MDKIDSYNEFASQYAELVAHREAAGVENEPSLPRMLEIIGDVSGLTVLDAGCGEGYLSRILAERGANITGIDISPRLVEIARAKDIERKITYNVANLSQPLPEYQQHFDLIVSYLVLNDVYDYKGFITTLGTSLERGGRLVLSMNNPYSYVVCNHITNYFDSETTFSYKGMAQRGVKVRAYQRTLEEYMDAFLSAGFQLQHLIDIPTPEKVLNYLDDKLIPKGYQFPYFMILGFVR